MLTLHASPDLWPLIRAKQHFETKLLKRENVGLAAQVPPQDVLKLISYKGPLGDMAAYVSPSPGDGKRHPAIIWLVGGFSNSIGDFAWTPGPEANDQSASGFRDAGIVMLYPSLRGGNDNPGCIENFMGEVDDVVAAARHLATLDYVDPERIYLGGHSTGGTLALLVAASTDQFRAVFALGPVGDVRGYGAETLAFDTSDNKEALLRAPKVWLKYIKTRTHIFEGAKNPGNADELAVLEQAKGRAPVTCHLIPDGNHFSIIRPLVTKIAKRIQENTTDEAGEF